MFPLVLELGVRELEGCELCAHCVDPRVSSMPSVRSERSNSTVGHGKLPLVRDLLLSCDGRFGWLQWMCGWRCVDVIYCAQGSTSDEACYPLGRPHHRGHRATQHSSSWAQRTRVVGIPRACNTTVVSHGLKLCDGVKNACECEHLGRGCDARGQDAPAHVTMATPSANCGTIGTSPKEQYLCSQLRLNAGHHQDECVSEPLSGPRVLHTRRNWRCPRDPNANT